MTACRALGALLFLIVLWFHTAHADRIVLVNGDRLTGKVVSKSGDTLKFRTEYAGEIAVQWKDVASITTDAPVTVLPVDGKMKNVRLEHAASGSVGLVSEGAMREVRLADLAYINPPAHVAGTGVTYRGRASLLGSASRGNTDDSSLYGEAELNARAKDYRYHLFGRAEQKEESGETTAQNYFVSGRRDQPIDEERFWYVRSSLEHDEFTDITLRAAAGAGLGWNIIDTSKTQFTLRGGLDYILASRDELPDETYPAFGWGIDYSHWLLPDRLEFFFDQTGFASLTSEGDVSSRTRTGLRAPLGSGFSANAQVNIDYEGDPGPGHDTTDTTLLFGVGYDF